METPAHEPARRTPVDDARLFLVSGGTYIGLGLAAALANGHRQRAPR